MNPITVLNSDDSHLEVTQRTRNDLLPMWSVRTVVGSYLVPWWLVFGLSLLVFGFWFFVARTWSCVACFR